MTRVASLLLSATVLAAVGCSGSKPAPTPVDALLDVAPPPSPAPAKFETRVVTAPADLPLVAVRIVFQAGSIDDSPGKEGITALTARMLAEGGTLELTSAKLLSALYPMAAEIDVETGKELTVFSGQVHRDHIDRYASLLLAAITRPRWDPAEFERMRGDAIQAIENDLRSSDDEALGKAALDTLMWRGHPYAHVELGTVQALKAMKLEELQAHAQQVFTQDRVLIGVGGSKDDRTVDSMRQDLASLPEKGRALVALPAPRAETPRVLIVQKQTDSTAISMGYPYALRRGNKDYFPMVVAMSALGQHRQFIGRLQKELRVKRGLNYGNYAYVEHFEQEGWGSLPALNIGRRQQDLTVWLRPVVAQNGLFAVRAALYQLERFAREGITQEELDTVKGFLGGYSLIMQQTPMRRLGSAIDSVYYSGPDYPGTLREKLKTMTVQEVNGAIRRWLRPDQLRIAIVTRDAEGLRKAMLEGQPSALQYAAQTPDAAVLAQDQKFAALPLNLEPEQVEVVKASELFER